MAGRGKAKAMAFPSEIIALGSKPGKVDGNTKSLDQNIKIFI
jgi:hypothetical protein